MSSCHPQLMHDPPYTIEMIFTCPSANIHLAEALLLVLASLTPLQVHYNLNPSSNSTGRFVPIYCCVLPPYVGITQNICWQVISHSPPHAFATTHTMLHCHTCRLTHGMGDTMHTIRTAACLHVSTTCLHSRCTRHAYYVRRRMQHRCGTQLHVVHYAYA